MPVIRYLANFAPFAYIILCWIQLGVTGSPASWNVLGRLLLAIIH